MKAMGWSKTLAVLGLVVGATAEGWSAPVPPAPVVLPSDGKLPITNPPFQALAQARGAKVLVRFGRAVHVSVVVIKDGQRVVTVQPRLEMQETAFPLSVVKAHDVRGKAISGPDLRRLLAKEAVVLVSSDGNPVEPLHLRIARDGVIVLMLPPQKVPAQAIGEIGR
jgi:hypothetical protein